MDAGPDWSDSPSRRLRDIQAGIDGLRAALERLDPGDAAGREQLLAMIETYRLMGATHVAQYEDGPLY